MERFSANARKYLVAVIGVGLLIGLRYLEIDIPGLPDIVRDLIVAAIAAEAVFQVPNSAPVPTDHAVNIKVVDPHDEPFGDA